METARFDFAPDRVEILGIRKGKGLFIARIHRRPEVEVISLKKRRNKLRFTRPRHPGDLDVFVYRDPTVSDLFICYQGRYVIIPLERTRELFDTLRKVIEWRENDG